MSKQAMTMADINADDARRAKLTPFPWRDDTIAEVERNGPWADLAGFERWLSRQDDDLDDAYSRMDIDAKTALYLAFIDACNFAAKDAK